MSRGWWTFPRVVADCDVIRLGLRLHRVTSFRSPLFRWLPRPAAGCCSGASGRGPGGGAASGTSAGGRRGGRG